MLIVQPINIGDGKWEERMGQKMPDSNYVCRFCFEQGWKVATNEDIQKDEDLKGKVGIVIDYENDK
jgi:hypothetical protein